MNSFKSLIKGKKLKQELSIKDGVVIVDKSSCDGCGVCVETCPHSAILVKSLSEEEIKGMSFLPKIKMNIKGYDKAQIIPMLCTKCGLCMENCHEFAIHKVKY